MAFAWDDLRLVLAVARGGTLAAAAQDLGVNHSTVFRRLTALEHDIGSKLFERMADGYRATEAGDRLIDAAERMETEALALDRDLTGRDARLSGQIRVTCSETLAMTVLLPQIASFRARHPGIAVDLTVDNRVIDMARREADVALRAARPTQGDLFGRKLADIHVGLFASRSYLKANGTPKSLSDLDRHRIIGWSDSAAQTRVSAWIARYVAKSAIGFRGSGLVTQYLAARAGLGIAVLPVYLAASEKNVVPVLDRMKDLMTELWIVTHRSLKDTARVRAFMDHVGPGVKARIEELSH